MASLIKSHLLAAILRDSQIDCGDVLAASTPDGLVSLGVQKFLIRLIPCGGEGKVEGFAWTQDGSKICSASSQFHPQWK